jgi:ribonuclease HIII
VQGGDAEVFAARFCDGLGQRKPGKSSQSATTELVPRLGEGPLIGSDEAGKGDYFGPLVTVACRAEPAERDELIQAGVADSKTLSDARLGAALRGRYSFAIEVLDPPQYNQEHLRTPNVNIILAGMHGRAIRHLAQDGDTALVDRFADEKLVANEVKDLKLDLYQTPRAEREPVVAAASIIARAVFLERLKELSEKYVIELLKGAGSPTDAAGRKFLALHGFDKLGQVAKLHFKNTKKIGG